MITPHLLPQIITAIAAVIENNAEEVTLLDQAIGDGDHVINLQRGLQALVLQQEELSQLDWPKAWQKIGMTLMSSVGGASGSLYATLFMALSKTHVELDVSLQSFSNAFSAAVDAVKKRGKSDAGEKTLLDVYIPVANYLKSVTNVEIDLATLLNEVSAVAIRGMESTRDMLATKGRASFLEERSLGHIDAGAKTAQLMICTIVDILVKQLATPA